jgi:hypothetical protein
MADMPRIKSQKPSLLLMLQSQLRVIRRISATIPHGALSLDGTLHLIRVFVVA